MNPTFPLTRRGWLSGLTAVTAAALARPAAATIAGVPEPLLWTPAPVGPPSVDARQGLVLSVTRGHDVLLRMSCSSKPAACASWEADHGAGLYLLDGAALCKVVVRTEWAR